MVRLRRPRFLLGLIDFLFSDGIEQTVNYLRDALMGFLVATRKRAVEDFPLLIYISCPDYGKAGAAFCCLPATRWWRYGSGFYLSPATDNGSQ